MFSGLCSGQGLVLTLTGGVLGVASALLTRLMKGLLFGGSATDAASFVGITLCSSSWLWRPRPGAPCRMARCDGCSGSLIG